MAEYVERNLERLLSVFELLKSNELLTDFELKEFVKRCRQYEYRLCKREKKPVDFFKYCDYLTDFLKLVQIRREAMQNLTMREEIDGPIKWKVAEMYRMCTERFKKLDFFERELEFLKWARLYGQASRCYTKMLQTHGNNATLHEKAARWEFFENRSAENARSILQLALRKFRTDINLWVALFDIELHYVRILAERRGLLVNKEDKEKNANKSTKKKGIDQVSADDIPDAVFQYKLADIVLTEAVDVIGEAEQPNLLYRLWKCSYSCLPLAEKIEASLYAKLWTDENIPEEAYLARIFKEKSDEISIYKQYDKALEEKPTEKMTRLYIDFCEDLQKSEDPFAPLKLLDLLKSLHEKNQAKEADYIRLIDLWDYSMELVKLEPFLEAGIRLNPGSVLFWDQLLGIKMHRLEEAKEDEKKLLKLFEEAIKQIPPSESLPIWMKFIDFTIATSQSPKKIDLVFENSILVTPPIVSSKLKSIRLKYLHEVYPEDTELFYQEYEKSAKKLPNEEDFHLEFVEIELNRKKQNLDMVHKAFNNAIVENGNKSLKCWLEYAKFLIKFKPEMVGGLTKRALSNIPATLTDEFHERWTRLIQETG